MDRSEAEAIYESGRERCVEVILELAGSVERLTGRGERLEERVRRLEEQSRESSRNSSQPPSRDRPKTRAERRAEARKRAKAWAKREGERKPGGQPGHKGSGRKLLPEDQVEVVDHYPEECRCCGRQFSEDERQPGRRFGRHQVAELPPIAVTFFEHRTHRLRCPGCGNKTTAELPEEIAGSPFGTGLQATVVTLTARNRVSRRDMSELAWDLFGLGLSTGAVDAICQRASAALADPHELLVEKVLSSPAVNVDETGWFTGHDPRTMWTATTPWAAIFRIAPDRHRDRLEELIGTDFKGILGSDRWWAYDHIDPASRQACWEHLKRDFFRHSEGLAEQKEFGQAGLALTKRLFKTWHAFEEHQDRGRLIREMKPIQDELRALLEHAGRNSKRTRLHRRFANNLLKIWPALFTFVTVEGVEPTNNSAERALRGPVIYRKLSHGTQSDDGERFIERALSASVTCRLQARSMFAYMRELLAASARGDPLPTLA
jgi:transposase